MSNWNQGHQERDNIEGVLAIAHARAKKAEAATRDAALRAEHAEAEVGVLRKDIAALKECESHRTCCVSKDSQCRNVEDIESNTQKAEAEVERLSGQVATFTDLANTWARESNVEECRDPYKDFSLRDLIDRLWCKSSDKQEKIRAECERERCAKQMDALADQAVIIQQSMCYKHAAKTIREAGQ